MEENQDFNLLPPYLVDSDGAQSPESQTQRTYGNPRKANKDNHDNESHHRVHSCYFY